MKHLAALKHLKDLDLMGNAITDSGMVAFETLPKLEHVSLFGAKVSDTGLRHLSRLLPKLETLDIQGTRATNACLRTLAAMPSLKLVFVRNTAISASSAGFVGVLHHSSIWYPNEAKAKEA